MMRCHISRIIPILLLASVLPAQTNRKPLRSLPYTPSLDLTAMDPYSPGGYRINGVVANMPEFGKAFACMAGQPMVRTKACKVW